MTLMNTSPYVIGIAGGTGSGKTHFVRRIISEIGAEKSTVIRQDSYYRDLSHLPLCDREKVNFDNPTSLDFDLLVSHLKDLKKGQEILVPVYDFTTHTRKKRLELVCPRPLIIVEGILVLHYRVLRSQLDLKVFLDVEPEIRLQRRISRDLVERGRSRDSVLHQYRETVLPMHHAYVEPSKRYADFLIPYHGKATRAFEQVVSALREEMRIETGD